MRMSANQSYGHKSELWAVTEFQARGYSARLISQWTDKFDIIVGDILPVEVKRSHPYWRTVRPGYKLQAWYFDVARIPQDQDFLLLLIAEDGFGQFWPHLVPSFHAFGRSTISITSHPRHYTGRWSASLNRWSVIEWLINIRQEKNQPSLFVGTGDNTQFRQEWGQKTSSATIRNGLSPFPIGVAA